LSGGKVVGGVDSEHFFIFFFEALLDLCKNENKKRIFRCFAFFVQFAGGVGFFFPVFALSF